MDAERGGDVDQEAALGDFLLLAAPAEGHRQAEDRLDSGDRLGQGVTVCQVSGGQANAPFGQAAGG
ncbi:hypothetical protein ABH927_000422 [Planotetraspora sp. GP83]